MCECVELGSESTYLCLVELCGDLKMTLKQNVHHDHRSALTVRRLHVRLSDEFSQHWNGQDAFMTAFANALSMSFPVGEQFFIDAVKGGLVKLQDVSDNAVLRDAVKKFIGQEATHRHLHSLFNAQIAKHGYRNRLERRLQMRIDAKRLELAQLGDAHSYLQELAMTCAVEHFTAILGDLILAREGQGNDWFKDAQEPLRVMWRWHAAEESEHKSVAFDLYLRLGGCEEDRVRWFRYFVWMFGFEFFSQVLYNLWCDGSWRQVSTWQSAMRFIFGKDGLLRSVAQPMRAYMKPGFHPIQYGDEALAQSWLARNANLWTPL
jgi:predicted metal-dependent hydrolase